MLYLVEIGLFRFLIGCADKGLKGRVAIQSGSLFLGVGSVGDESGRLSVR